MEKLEFHVRGMDHADEVALLKKALAPLGLREEHLSFDLLNGRLVVQPPTGLDDQAVRKAVAGIGLKAELLTPLGEAVPGG